MADCAGVHVPFLGHWPPKVLIDSNAGDFLECTERIELYNIYFTIYFKDQLECQVTFVIACSSNIFNWTRR